MTPFLEFRTHTPIALAAAVLVLSPALASGQTLSDPFQRSFQGVVNNEQETTSGAAWSDIDNDGDLDLFVSAYLNRNNFLYENLGGGSFRRVRTGLPVSDAGLSSGAAWADIDNDGDDDLFVANQQGQDNFLYRNLGGGEFERVDGPITRDRGDSYAAAWADFDRDGRVDLFVTNRSGESDFLYRNLGDGQFERIRGGPVVEARGNSFTAAWADYDGDGLPDLFVPSLDAENPSSLYRNLGGGEFERVDEGPIAVDAAVSRRAAWGDYDNDGDLDLFVANGGAFSGNEQVPFLYRNDDGRLVRVMSSPVVQHPISGADAVWFDMDNDGDLDLFVGAYRDHNLVFRNEGGSGFTRITTGWAAGHGGFTDAAAVADYDRDGDLDLYLTHWEAQNDMLLTNGGNDNHWLAVRLEGTRSNRSGIGAAVRATAVSDGREVSQLRQVGTGRSGRGQDAREAHFGLGDAERVRSLTITWPSGHETDLGPVDADQFLLVREGAGVVAATPPRDGASFPSPSGMVYDAFISDGVAGALDAFRSLEGRVPEAERIAGLAGATRYVFDSVDRNEGMALLSAVVDELPDRPWPVFVAAELYRATGQTERAVRMYETVLELLPRVEDINPDDARWMERVSRRYSDHGG